MTPPPAARRYRRCGPVWLECVDQLTLDPLRLLQGELAQQRLPLVQAYAPPRPDPIEIDALAAACLAALATGISVELPAEWAMLPAVEAALQRLLEAGLIEAGPGDTAEAPLRRDLPSDDWNGAAALYHYSSRWSGVIARDEIPLEHEGAVRAFAASRAAFEQQAQWRGTAPTHRPARGAVEQAIRLPRAAPDAFDALLDARETHRLFDTERPLELAALAQLLQRSFAATGVAPLGGGLSALRKHIPSGGGMHPVEAYPLVLDVAGLAPGWYHYRACDHALAPLRGLDVASARATLGRLAAGQTYFASAPVAIALTLRFPRHHWKYPRHARAYRVMLLEAGHAGQMFYLAATAAGLGAFFTAAINDADVDTELGLDGIDEGCIALLGCGHPAAGGDALRLSRYVAAD